MAKCFPKIDPMDGVIRFGKMKKFRPRYMWPFEILKRLRTVAYELGLSLELSAIYNVFHISILRKYVLDFGHVINPQSLEIHSYLTYEETPIVILDRKIRIIQNKENP